jgi:hypothetical protein
MTIPSTAGVLGFANDSADSVAKHITGTVIIANDTTYTYALAAAAVAAAGTVVLSGVYNGPMTTAAGSTHTHDVAAPGVPAGSYAWFKAVTSPFSL